MLKHVGKHNNRKIVLLFREVPGEDHMCLVSYSDGLPSMIHDEVMKVLESAAGQQSANLSDALFRHIMPNGENTLESMHNRGLIKKVQTNQVLITPNAASSVRLDELNKILNEMTSGQDAVKRLAEIDAAKDYHAGKTTKPKRGRDVGEPAATSTTASLLSDADLAQQRRKQAENMKADAARLLQEAEALMAEAVKLDPKANDTTKKKKTRTKVTQD